MFFCLIFFSFPILNQQYLRILTKYFCKLKLALPHFSIFFIEKIQPLMNLFDSTGFLRRRQYSRDSIRMRNAMENRMATLINLVLEKTIYVLKAIILSSKSILSISETWSHSHTHKYAHTDTRALNIEQKKNLKSIWWLDKEAKAKKKNPHKGKITTMWLIFFYYVQQC